MKRKRHTPQEIIAKLREAEVELNQGATIEVISRKLEISEQTFHRWRHLYGRMKGPEMARMKEPPYLYAISHKLRFGGLMAARITTALLFLAESSDNSLRPVTHGTVECF
jgi:transposase-like protein